MPVKCSGCFFDKCKSKFLKVVSPWDSPSFYFLAANNKKEMGRLLSCLFTQIYLSKWPDKYREESREWQRPGNILVITLCLLPWRSHCWCLPVEHQVCTWASFGFFSPIHLPPGLADPSPLSHKHLCTSVKTSAVNMCTSISLKNAQSQ